MRQLAGLVLAGLLAVGAITARAQDAEADWLAVISGRLLETGEATLTIDAYPQVVMFTDRPERLVKMMDIAQLVAIAWGTTDVFAGDPPNASLVEAETGDIAIIEITGVTLADGVLTVTYALLEGRLPPPRTNVGLTIDAFPTAVNAQITDS